MKKIVVVLAVILLLFSCDNDIAERNPYLQETSFSFDINLNLPLYSDLNNPLIPIHIENAGVGIRGVFVMNTGSSFVAWEASCPNHIPSACSTMTIDGINCECSCEGYKYTLVNGNVTDTETEEPLYTLLNYSAFYSESTNVVRISN